MKAVVFHGVGDIRLDDVPEPKIEQATDAIVRLTASAVCGTDLHMVRGTLPGMEPGTVLGHEGVGVVEEVGPQVRNLRPGDRVVIPSTIACGYCSYCRTGYQAQCDNANPNGQRAGTAFYGGPKATGGFHGLQAEYARIPYAHVNLVPLPDDITDDEAILISDIFPTGYFGAELAEITHGDTAVVFGCGPVGQFAIAGAQLLGADRVLAVDTLPARLDMARAQGAEVIDFNEEDPVTAILELTGGIGPDRAIDAVGVDAEPASRGPAAEQSGQQAEQFRQERQQAAPETNPDHGLWEPGQAPSQALQWATQSLAKAGTLGIIGVYPPTHTSYPIGAALQKNLTLKMGNCHHRRYIPELLHLVRNHTVSPLDVLTHMEPMTSAIAAYEAFDQRQPGWIKVEVVPGTGT